MLQNQNCLGARGQVARSRAFFLILQRTTGAFPSLPMGRQGHQQGDLEHGLSGAPGPKKL